MSAETLPPPTDLNSETKKGIIDGLKKVIAAFQGAGLLDRSLTYAHVIHDPKVLHSFIQTYRDNPEVADKIVLSKANKPVRKDDEILVCGVNLAQVQQLLVRTCARRVLEAGTREDEGVVTETRTVKRFLFFKKTETFEVKTGGGYDERKVRELSRYMAFDWQLPLLLDYPKLTAAHIMELDTDLIHLRTPEDIAFVAELDPALLKKVKQTTGADFPDILAQRPQAIPGIAYWSKDMYALYRATLGDKAFEFFARDKAFFMVCASLDKPLVKIYGDVLCYIAAPNLEEIERLNIDKTDVLLSGMKFAFGDKLKDVLSNPAFAKDVLRKLVESLIHLTQEKEQMIVSAQLTCKAIAPQVAQWLAKQQNS